MTAFAAEAITPLIPLPSQRELVSRFRRDLLLSSLLRRFILALAIAGVFVGPMIGRRTEGTLLFIALGAIWIHFGSRSVRSTRITADVPTLIRADRTALAEQQLARALVPFSLFSGIKLLAMHHLALLRYTQRRWPETIELCRTLLSQSDRTLGPLSRSARLMLADALIQVGDFAGAYPQLASLYAMRLNLNETLQLLQVQLDYESRLGAWQSMVSNIRGKIALAEIMPTRDAARTQACLALATHKLNYGVWSHWLRRRCELLVDPATLIEDRPLLSELWNPSTAGTP